MTDVTDEEIRALRDWARAQGDEDKPARRVAQECNLALNLPPGFDRDQWRARCAAIIATRKEQP